MPWGLFDGAVDGFIVEVLVDVAFIAGDPGNRGPAVDVSVEWVQGVREEVHGGVGDGFLWRAERSIVWADVVAFASEEVLEFADFGVRAAFGDDAK